MTKWSICIVGVVLSVAISGFFWGPEERILAIKEEWLRVTKNPAQICFDIWKDRLKDPRSAYIEDSFESEGRVSVFYRAKNGFGAYELGVFECPMRNGEVDESEARIEKMFGDK